MVEAFQAGFPSPAEDLGEKRIDLTQVLITHPQATYLVRARGVSMVEAGIFDNDILVVNRAIKPRHQHIVVALSMANSRSSTCTSGLDGQTPGCQPHIRRHRAERRPDPRDLGRCHQRHQANSKREHGNMYALIDGNNYFVSCERVFPSQPERSSCCCAVVQMMVAPLLAAMKPRRLESKWAHRWFQLKAMEETEGLIALSANFALYGDLSDRMMSLAAGLGPRQEIYSIDESFVDLTGVRGDLVERSHKIRSRILQWVGIPCGIGIGPTKTLAKLGQPCGQDGRAQTWQLSGTPGTGLQPGGTA